jgi:hypothetical protein
MNSWHLLQEKDGKTEVKAGHKMHHGPQIYKSYCHIQKPRSATYWPQRDRIFQVEVLEIMK